MTDQPENAEPLDNPAVSHSAADSPLVNNANPNQSVEDTGVDETTEKVPAVDVPLIGRYLIEASAGTGKTWTLTGIMLRLLIEARRAPEQIIATTFTRAAAVEMRERIHDRLLDFYQLLKWIRALQEDEKNLPHLYPEALIIVPETTTNTTKNTSTNTSTSQKAEQATSQATSHVHVDADMTQEIPPSTDETATLNQTTTDKQNQGQAKIAQKEAREAWLKGQANDTKLSKLIDIVNDPINLHLIGFLLNRKFTYSLEEATRRTALVLTTLDKLFVGTLDSLAQKWLTEYSSETGYQQGMAIIEESEIAQITDSIIHDELRQFQSRLYHTQPKVYDLMDQQGLLTTIADHRKSVAKALSFMSAPVDEVALPAFDISELESLIERFTQLDVKPVEPYLDISYRVDIGFAKTGVLHKTFWTLPNIYDKICQHGILYQAYLDNDEQRFLIALNNANLPNDKGIRTGLSKTHEVENEIFLALPVINVLLQIEATYKQFSDYLDSLLAQLNYHIVQTTRQKLPIILEERGQTTFSLQMVRLNQALTGPQGEKLARYIRHHYPVALIDESQDINGEQALMIEQIYLSKSKKNTASIEDEKKDIGFLLLVGDPKQAIYGFRGGDVANYNYMKKQFNSRSHMSLNINRRSSASLITSLNHWFNMPDSTTKPNNLSSLGQSISYHYITAAKTDSQLSWLIDDNERSKYSNTAHEETAAILPQLPVGLLHLPEGADGKYDECETVACHIAMLLNSGQTLNGQSIQPSDIGVLGRVKSDLKQVEDMLVKLGVPTLTTSEVSIFETTMAADIASLMAVMLKPYRHDMVNRVLTSHLYGLSLDEVTAMMASHDSGEAIDSSSEAIDSSSDALNNDEIVNQENTGEDFNNASHKNYQEFLSHIKEAAIRWQNYGILSALHYLLEENKLHPKGVWQSLASQKNGERHIMDLRQILDILAQYGMVMGEHELLAWYQQQMDSAPTTDWARQQPLPTDSGVQLMTIHKSKGLEFPIVYVLGIDSGVKTVGQGKKYGLYLYDTQKTERVDTAAQSGASTMNNQPPITAIRRLSPIKGTATNDSYFTDQVTNEELEEQKRLVYVALTRASEQLFIVIKDEKTTPTSNKRTIENALSSKYKRHPLKQWLRSKETYTLPDHLKGQVADINELQTLYEFIGKYQSDKKANKTGNKNNVEKATRNNTIQYPDIDTVMSQKRFTGWAKTSFTALARQLDDSVQALAVMDERMDDGMDIITATDVTQTTIGTELLSSHLYIIKPPEDIRFSFVRGANPGTFLHEVFEKIDFANQEHWSQVIDRAVSSYQLPLIYASYEHQQRIRQNDSADKMATHKVNEADKDGHSESLAPEHDALKKWISEVLQTPLLASNQALENIKPQQRFAELGFNMGLSEDFQVQKINDLFTRYLPEDVDKHIQLNAQNSQQLYRYLRGEIDLVYEHAGKYYIADYKSNYLGDSLTDYGQDALNSAMNKAGYWLQAAIYQVALHRFLSMRIADYKDNEADYLGPVEYIFLRGTYQNKDSVQQDNEQGRQTYGLVIWDIPIEFVKALDRLLGKPQF